jgi:capsular polysaccharide biosynthesis protein
VEKEITLGDYGRVLWGGRWILLATAIGAALVGLVISLARPTEYTSSSTVYLGLATTARTGTPVSTPYTTPATAQKALAADKFVEAAAKQAGVSFDRVKGGVSFVVERVPGAAGGNQPTVATIRYTDTNRANARKVVNAYAEGVFGEVQGFYSGVLTAEQDIVDHATARLGQVQKSLDALRAENTPATSTALVSLQQEYATLQQSADEAALLLAKTKQIEQPQILSAATSAASSASPRQRLRTILFGTVLGLIVGAIATFLRRGSPAGRANA